MLRPSVDILDCNQESDLHWNIRLSGQFWRIGARICLIFFRLERGTRIQKGFHILIFWMPRWYYSASPWIRASCKARDSQFSAPLSFLWVWFNMPIPEDSLVWKGAQKWKGGGIINECSSGRRPQAHVDALLYGIMLCFFLASCINRIPSIL